MNPKDRERITHLVNQIQTESDSAKLLALMDELNALLGDREVEIAVLRAGRTLIGRETEKA